MSASGNNSRKQHSHRNLVEAGSWNVLSFPSTENRTQQPKHFIQSLLLPGTQVEALLSFSSPFPFFLHETCWWSFPCSPHTHQTYPPQLLHHQTWKPKRQSEHTCKRFPGRRMERHTASCPAFGHNLPCPNTWKEKAGELPAREAAKGGEGSLQNQKVSWDQGHVLSQILTGLLPFGSYGILGDIKSSRDWDPAREETWDSSGKTKVLLPQVHNQATSSGQWDATLQE